MNFMIVTVYQQINMVGSMQKKINVDTAIGQKSVQIQGHDHWFQYLAKIKISKAVIFEHVVFSKNIK